MPKPPQKKPNRRKPQIPPSAPATSKRGVHKRRKNNPVEHDADMVFLLEKKLLGWPREKIFDAMNERRMVIARKAALERGASKEEAEASALDARISFYTLATDTTRLLSSFREAKVYAAEMLARNRILELQEELLHLNIIEREAWESYFASKAGKVDVETSTTVETVAQGSGNRPAGGEEPWEDEPDAPARRGGGKTVTRKRKPRTPEEGWLAVAVKCVHDRVEISDRIYKLAGQLGLWTTLPAEVQELHAVGADDLEALFAYSIRHLWSAEAMIAGNQGEALDRARLVMGAIGQARQLAGRGKGDNAPGAPQLHELVIKVLPPGGGSEAN